MNKVEVLNRFFSSFEIPAYPRGGVPKDTTFPWLVYDTPDGSWGDEVSCSVDLWFHTESEQVPYKKVKQIGDAIGQGGHMLRCDEGVIWVKKAVPFSVSLTDENDATIKRRNLTLMLEFMTL